jgi:hypothetical protein
MSKKIVKKDDPCRVIARQEKQKELLIEQLRRIPIIQISCEKLNIARSTLYRWRDEDKEFEQKITEALNKGRMIVNDMAESKLLAAIQSGNMTAIIYWLKHNHKNYRERKPKFEAEDIEPINLIIEQYNPDKFKDCKTGSHHLFRQENDDQPRKLIRSSQEEIDDDDDYEDD